MSNNNNNNNNNNFSFVELNNFFNQGFINSFNNENTNNNNITININNNNNNDDEENENNKENNKTHFKFKPNINMARIPIENDNKNSDKTISQSNNNNDNNNKNQNEDDSNDITKNFKQKPKKNDIKREYGKMTYKLSEINPYIAKIENIDQKKKKEEKNNEQYDIENVINQMKENNPNAYLPILLPFKNNENYDEDNNTINAIKNENNINIFQFPRQLPFNLETQENQKFEETETEEPNYDENGYLIKKEFKNIFKEIPKNKKIGKLKIYKSGKVKMVFGNDVNFNVVDGSQIKFAQEIVLIDDKNDNAYMLGKAKNKKLIIIPDINI